MPGERKSGTVRKSLGLIQARVYVRICRQPRELTSSSSTKACARHDDNFGSFAIFDELRDGGETALVKLDGRSAVVKHGLIVTHFPVLLAVLGFAIGLRPFLLVTSFALATYLDGLEGEMQMQCNKKLQNVSGRKNASYMRYVEGTEVDLCLVSSCLSR